MAEERRVIVFKVEPKQLQEELSKWDQLPDKQSGQMKVSKFIESIFDRVDALRDKGYDWKDISDLLETSFNTKVAPGTIQQYYGKIRKKKEIEARKLSRSKKLIDKLEKPSSTVETGAKEADVKVSQTKKFSEVHSVTKLTTDFTATDDPHTILSVPEECQPIDEAIDVAEVKKERLVSENGFNEREVKAQNPQPQHLDRIETKKSRFNSLVMDNSKL
jgi:hypothetical protein